MVGAYEVRVLEAHRVEDIPPRFAEAGIRELITAMGGEAEEDAPVDEALRAALSLHPFQQMAEQLLDLVLLQPPIPAYCESLVRAMQDPAHAPWRDHDVREDRFSLWYAHRLLHRAFPEQYPSPEARHVALQVVTASADARPPGPRTAPHERTAFAAALLPAPPHDVASGTEPGAWAYDALWAVEAAPRQALDEAACLAAGVPFPASATRIDLWAPPGVLDTLETGARWHVGVDGPSAAR